MNPQISAMRMFLTNRSDTYAFQWTAYPKTISRWSWDILEALTDSSVAGALNKLLTYTTHLWLKCGTWSWRRWNPIWTPIRQYAFSTHRNTHKLPTTGSTTLANQKVSSVWTCKWSVNITMKPMPLCGAKSMPSRPDWSVVTSVYLLFASTAWQLDCSARTRKKWLPHKQQWQIMQTDTFASMTKRQTAIYSWTWWPSS